MLRGIGAGLYSGGMAAMIAIQQAMLGSGSIALLARTGGCTAAGGKGGPKCTKGGHIRPFECNVFEYTIKIYVTRV